MQRVIAACAVLFLIVVAAYVGYVEYQNYNSPLATCQRERAQGYRVGEIIIAPALRVEFGTTSGTFTVEIDGSACSPITGFAITSIHPQLDGVVNASFVDYKGKPISPTNPEPVGKPVYGSISVSNATVGQTFSFNYTITAKYPGWGSSGASAFNVTGYDLVNAPIGQDLTRAVEYLLSYYNPRLGLIPETPSSSVYWLYSDNYLADLALAHYVGVNFAEANKVAANISASLSKYFSPGSVENQYTVLEPTVLESNKMCDFLTAENNTVQASDGFQIKTTVNDGSGSLNRTQYTDIAFLDTICEYNHSHPGEAMVAYKDGANLFDGRGFRDRPYVDPTSSQYHQYQTFKLALYVYAGVVLDQPINMTAMSALLGMQASNGGFLTGYDGSYSTSTNTETTSLAIIAMESVLYQEPPLI